MKLFDQCSSCLYSSSSEILPPEISDSNGNTGKRNKILGPLKELAQLIFCEGDKKICNRDYYTKFYTSKGIQPKFFNASKKYQVERKHKIKKRDSFRRTDTDESKSGNIDEIKGECEGHSVFSAQMNIFSDARESSKFKK